MDLILSFLLIAGVISTGGATGPCYTFDGDSYVKYEDGLDLSNSTHFKLRFKTGNGRGLLYYAEGTYFMNTPHDYEGLFIRKGILNYFMYNPTEYGTGKTFGIHVKSSARVDDNKWHTVEFFRNRLVKTTDKNDDEIDVYQSGMILDDNESHVDNRFREEVMIKEPIWLGKHDPMDRLGKSIRGFTGDISDFMEVSHGHIFDEHAGVGGNPQLCI